MKWINIIIFSDNHEKFTQLKLPSIIITCIFMCFLLGSFFFGYWIYDYYNLKKIHKKYNYIVSQNRSLQAESKIILGHLEEVKDSLLNLETFTDKVRTLLSINFKGISKKTGIKDLDPKEPLDYAAKKLSPPKQFLEKSLPLLNLKFKNFILYDTLSEVLNINKISEEQLFNIKNLLTNMARDQYTFKSIPSIYPAKGWLASKFGYRISPFTGEKRFHKGIDIAAPMGTPIFAPADGIVVFSGKKSGFGELVIIAHYGHGIVTHYGHNDQNIVQVGQRVKRGDQIATVGNSGRSTGPHVHYEVHVDGQVVNPLKFILSSSPLLAGN